MATSLMTWQAFSVIGDPGHRHELIRGELLTLAHRYINDGAILSTLACELGIHAKRVGGTVFATIGCLLESSPDTVRTAPVSFASPARWNRYDDSDYYFIGAPDLIVELPPHDQPEHYMPQKVEAWLAAGARLVWVVDPRRKVVIVDRPNAEPQTFREGDTHDAGDVVPGFTLPVAEIFA